MKISDLYCFFTEHRELGKEAAHGRKLSFVVKNDNELMHMVSVANAVGNMIVYKLENSERNKVYFIRSSTTHDAMIISSKPMWIINNILCDSPSSWNDTDDNKCIMTYMSLFNSISYKTVDISNVKTMAIDTVKDCNHFLFYKSEAEHIILPTCGLYTGASAGMMFSMSSLLKRVDGIERIRFEYNGDKDNKPISSIDISAMFAGCTNIEDIDLSNLVIPESCTEVDVCSLFDFCEQLKSLKFPKFNENISFVKNSSNPNGVLGCYNLQSIETYGNKNLLSTYANGIDTLLKLLKNTMNNGNYSSHALGKLSEDIERHERLLKLLGIEDKGG